MAGASTGVYKFNSAVRVHHVYETVWTPLIDKMLQMHDTGRYQRTR